MLLWKQKKAAAWLIALAVLCACGKKEEAAPPAEPSSKYIYVASGTTYAGNGVTMSSPANTIAKYDLNGVLQKVLVDYTTFPGDTPVALVDYDSANLMVAIENATNTGSRRLDLVRKDGSGTSTFLFSAAAFSAATAILQDVFPSADGGFLVSRGQAAGNAAIEKFTSSKARVLLGANPYVTTPTGSCATATTRFPRVVAGPSGVLVMGHAAASPNNKLLLISSSGFSTGTDCLAGVALPTVNHYPTAMLYVSAKSKLLVAFSNTTGPVQEIYAYDITATSISNGVRIYRDFSVLQGISAMALTSDGSVLVASSSSTFNTIEKFAYDATAATLTRATTTPLIAPSVYSRSIAGVASPAE